MPAIMHNMLSQFAARQLQVSDASKAKSCEKLSSGYRVNRSADDAAGLSISEKLRWQVRGLKKASGNISDGMSLLNVADGALTEVHKMLQRMNELTIQAANDTNTYVDRSAIQREINQLVQEIERIGTDTRYNTMPVFDSGIISDSGEVTPPADDTINDVTLSLPQGIDMAVSASNIDLLLRKNADGSYELEDGYTYTLASDITMTSFHISSGAAVAIKDSSIKGCGITCDNAELYLSNVNIINDRTNYDGPPIECLGNMVINFLGTNSMGGSNCTDNSTYNRSYAGIQVENGNSLVLNGNGTLFADGYESSAGIGSKGIDVNPIKNRDNRNKPLNKSGDITIHSGSIYARSNNHSSSFKGSGIGGGYYSLNGNITIDGGWISAYGASGIGCGESDNPTVVATPYRYKKYSPDEAGTITISGGIVNARGSYGGAGIGGGKGGSGVNVTISGGEVRAEGSRTDYQAGAGIGSGSCEYTDYGYNNKNECFSGNITITGGKVTAVSGGMPDKDKDSIASSAIGMGACQQLPDKPIINQPVNQIAQKKWFDGIGTLMIDGQTEDMYIEGRSEQIADGRYIFTYDPKTPDTPGTPDSRQGLWWIQMGAKNKNGIFISTGKISPKDLEIDGLMVYFYNDACRAMAKVQNAIDKVSRIRSHIGAQYNRLERGMMIDDSTAQYSQAAESRIRDADMAQEMVDNAKHNIIQQAACSMLAQANQAPNGVLSLLLP